MNRAENGCNGDNTGGRGGRQGHEVPAERRLFADEADTKDERYQPYDHFTMRGGAVYSIYKCVPKGQVKQGGKTVY